jgi:2-polyprenyl-6-methoxyphenol hydroxylase-like FAD-dependent oxidoreductase
MSHAIANQAVVIGAGIGGLAAARVLADYFERVVVVERDTLPPAPAERAGTPQAKHAHVLLAGGQRALSAAFPGFEDDLARAGAVPLRVDLDIRRERPGYDPFPRRDFGWLVYSMSRPLIEFVVRTRLQQLANVTLRERCRAVAAEMAPDGTTIATVQCETEYGQRETIPADLVVDASGSGSLTLGVLRSVGQPPVETAIEVDVGYATAVFAVPADAAPDWKSVMTFPHVPDSTRGALLLPLEGNRWMVTAIGRFGDKPPGDRNGFLAFAAQLRTPTISDAIARAEWLGEVARFGFPASVRRHFERLPSFPRGLLPFGDAICCFNPVYGQGMSVAAQEACRLRELLAARTGDPDPLAGLGPAFLREIQAVIETPWTMAAGLDFAYPQTGGRRPKDLASTLEFGSALLRLAAQDSAVHELTLEVLHLLKPQSVYRDAELVRRALAATFDA